jgi:hypothetical protein
MVNYFWRQLVILGRSFTHWRIIIVSLIELLLIVLSVLLMRLMVPMMDEKFSILYSAPRLEGTIMQMPVEMQMEQTQLLRESALGFLGYLALLILLLFCLYSAARMAQWAAILHRRMSLLLWARFLAYNLMISAVFILWIFAGYMLLKEEIVPLFFLLSLILFFVLHTLWQIQLANQGRIWAAMKRVFATFRMAHKLIIPFGMTFIAFGFILMFLGSMMLRLGDYYGVSLLTIFVVYMGWIKVYLAETLNWEKFK